MTSMTPGTAEFLLAFADNEHLMGQQHTEWIGVAPLPRRGHGIRQHRPG